MYVIVHHNFKDPATAMKRGDKLAKNEGAPQGVRGLEFYPSRDGKRATCLWEAGSVGDVQRYIDETLGDASENSYYEVNTEQSFSERPMVSQPPSRRAAA